MKWYYIENRPENEVEIIASFDSEEEANIYYRNAYSSDLGVPREYWNERSFWCVVSEEEI